jgi:2-keto-4-pentenoate hydratase
MNAALADALVAARRHHALLRASEWGPALHEPGCAYIVQDEVARDMGWFDAAPPMHWKSGGPSREQPLTHAALPPHGVRASGASFEDLRFHAPGIEAEIALRLRDDVTPERAASLRHEDADALVDAMMVSVEIVDSRWLEGGSAPALLRLADLQSHGGLALGEAVPYARRDWSVQACVVTVGGSSPVVNRGTHSLRDPAWLLPVWLRHATRNGDVVPAGAVVTTGTWCGVVPVRGGDSVVVEFEGVGRVAVRI